MANSIKNVINSDNWSITNIMQGYNGLIRIDAKTRNRIADGENHFSKWCSEKYANVFLKNKYGKKAHEMNTYRY